MNDKTSGKYKIYKGKAVIKVTVIRTKGDTGALELNVRLQACSNKACLLPATIKVPVP